MIVTIIISLQIYTYCKCYFGEDYSVVKTCTPGQYDILHITLYVLTV